MKLEKVVAGLKKSAGEKVPNTAKLIPASDILLDDYVRLKCKYGCSRFAKRFTCPPYTPTADETRKLLKTYKWALLFEFTGLKDGGMQGNLHEVMYQLEREAFLAGLHRAFAYTCGPCRICKTCPAETIDNPTEFDKKNCKHPVKARPSMESCGIDVFGTARKAGFKITPVKEGENFKSFALLLLD